MFCESPLNTSYFPGNDQTLDKRTDFVNFGQALGKSKRIFHSVFSPNFNYELDFLKMSQKHVNLRLIRVYQNLNLVTGLLYVPFTLKDF